MQIKLIFFSENFRFCAMNDKWRFIDETSNRHVTSGLLSTNMKTNKCVPKPKKENRFCRRDKTVIHVTMFSNVRFEFFGRHNSIVSMYLWRTNHRRWQTRNTFVIVTFHHNLPSFFGFADEKYKLFIFSAYDVYMIFLSVRQMKANNFTTKCENCKIFLIDNWFKSHLDNGISSEIECNRSIFSWRRLLKP